MGQKYRYPPVVEALVELSFRDSDWDETVQGRFYERIKPAGLTEKSSSPVQVAQVSVEGTSETTARFHHQSRMRFSSSDGSRIIQLARDLLVVNQLQPYPHFEEWSPQIARALDIYDELCKPSGVARIGVRYINKVVVPEQEFDLRTYFSIHPELPADLGEAHGAFLLRVELPVKVGGHQVLVTFGSAPPPKGGGRAFLLDLYGVLRPESPLPLSSIMEEIGRAHEHVEAAFEASITDALRSRFDPEKQL